MSQNIIKTKSITPEFTDKEVTERSAVRSFISYKSLIDRANINDTRNILIGYNVTEDGLELIWKNF